MRLVIASDAHIGLKVAGNNHNYYIENALDQVADATQRADLFVFLGDLFDYPNPTPSDYAVACRFIEAIGCPGLFLKGNHDEARGLQDDALEPFRWFRFNKDMYFPKFPTIVVVKDKKFLVASHSNDAKLSESCSSAQNYLDQLFESANSIDVIFAHLWPRGSMLNEIEIQPGPNELIMPDVEKFDCPIFCGHLHEQQQIGKVQVVGSVIPTNFGASGDCVYFEGDI